MVHRLTKVQRRVLQWMRDDQGQLRFETGHKLTSLVEGKGSADNEVFCQTLVLYFLIQHGYVERAAGIRMYRLTAKGQQKTRARR